MPGTGITIYFVGVCTHIVNRKVVDGEIVPVDPAIAVPHRVVLVDPDPPEPIHCQTPPLHVARLKQIGGTMVSGSYPRLPRNMVLSIQNASSGDVTYQHETWDHVPNLQVQAPGAPLQLKNAVVVDHGAPANIYFDVEQGTFSAGRVLTTAAEDHRPVMAVLHVAVSGDPTLLISDFSGSTQSSVTFSAGSIIQLSNQGADAGDSLNDFLLHYLNFDPFTETIVVPTTSSTSLPVIEDADPSHELTTGCSNSTYP